MENRMNLKYKLEYFNKRYKQKMNIVVKAINDKEALTKATTISNELIYKQEHPNYTESDFKIIEKREQLKFNLLRYDYVTLDNSAVNSIKVRTETNATYCVECQIVKKHKTKKDQIMTIYVDLWGDFTMDEKHDFNIIEKPKKDIKRI